MAAWTGKRSEQFLSVPLIMYLPVNTSEMIDLMYMTSVLVIMSADELNHKTEPQT